MASVTFRSLVNRVAYISGENIAPDGRNPVTLVTEFMNAELELYHDVVLLHSDRALKRTTVSTTATTTDGSDGFPQNQRVALPTDFGVLRGAAIRYTDGEWMPLKRATEHFRAEHLALPGLPTEAEVATISGASYLRLSPPADSVYTIEILYLPQVTEAGIDTTVELLPGGADWIAYGTALRVMQANGADEPGAVSLARDQYQRAVAHVQEYAAKQNRSGPLRMTETDRALPTARMNRWLHRGP